MSPVLWRGRASSLVLTWGLIAFFSVVTGIIVLSNMYATNPSKRLSGADWWFPVIILTFALLIALWTARATVEVDNEEFRVRFGPGWPLRRFPWASIATVEYTNVRPSQYGGLGYKVVLRKRTQALVLRTGDGLRISFVDGRVFVVSVDGARQGLEVIRKILSTK